MVGAAALRLVPVAAFLLLLVPVLVQEYPLDDGRAGNGFEARAAPEGTWTGGTVPDERSYFGWAQLYWETGHLSVPVADLGAERRAEVGVVVGADAAGSRLVEARSVPAGGPSGPGGGPQGPGAREAGPGEPRPGEPGRGATGATGAGGPGPRPAPGAAVEVVVRDGTGRPVAGVPVQILDGGRVAAQGGTDAAGRWRSPVLPPGVEAEAAGVRVVPQAAGLYGTLALQVRPQPGPYGLALDVQARLPGRDGEPLDGVALRSLPTRGGTDGAGADGSGTDGARTDGAGTGGEGTDRAEEGASLGATDEAGRLGLVLPWGGGAQRLVASRPTLGLDAPQVSAVVSHDGRLHAVHHWPPGYSLLLVGFWLTHTVHLVTPLSAAALVASVAWLGRRLAGPWAGLAAALLCIGSGVLWLLVYGRGMADLPSAAAAAAGAALCVRLCDLAVRRAPWWHQGGVAVAAAALSGFAVVSRYSNVLVLLGPALYVALCLARGRTPDSPSEGPAARAVSGPAALRTGRTGAKPTRAAPPREPAAGERRLRLLVAFVPFLLVLGAIGLWLAHYNDTFFGGPLRGGYQAGPGLPGGPGAVGAAGSASGAAVDETLFERYFHPSPAAGSNLVDRVLPMLWLFLPALLLAPLGLWAARRRAGLLLLALGWAVPLLVAYGQLTWVGQAGWEDLRYYLPALPPLALLAGAGLAPALEDRRLRIGVGVALAALLVVALATALHAIDVQQARLLRRPVVQAAPAWVAWVAGPALAAAAGAVGWSGVAAGGRTARAARVARMARGASATSRTTAPPGSARRGPEGPPEAGRT